MKLKFYQNALKWTAVTMSAATMVFSPVALGKEAETVTRAQVADALRELGMQRQTTVGEFWDKIKSDVPGSVYQGLNGFVEQNRNMVMPEVSLGTLKSSSGEEIPVVRFTQNGRTDTIQFFGQKNKMIKYNGVTLSQNDLIRIRDAEAKIEASDLKLKQESDQYKQQFERARSNAQMARDFARFKGFPRLTPQMWKSMTQQQKAQYIVSMRSMWLDAIRVNNVYRKPTSVKKPAKKKSAFFEGIDLLLGTPAYAINQPPNGTPGARVITSSSIRVPPVPPPIDDTLPGNPNATTTDTADVGAPPAAPAASAAWNGQNQTRVYNGNCIVAGYVSRYNRGSGETYGTRDTTEGCSYDLVRSNPTYSANTDVTAAISTCQSQRKVSCNPLVYGYQDDGQPICISSQQTEPRAQFQGATHFNGPCETFADGGHGGHDRHLSDSDFSVAGLSEDQRIARIDQDQKTHNYDQTKHYLESVLASKDAKNGTSLKSAFTSNTWNQQLDDQLVGIQEAFQNEIRQAIQSCDASPGPHEPNQVAACEQLHRRWLFTENFISQIRSNACPPNSSYIWPIDGTKLMTDAANSQARTNNKTQYTGQEWCRCNAPSSGSSQPPAVPPSGPPPALQTGAPISSGRTVKFLGAGGSCDGSPEVPATPSGPPPGPAPQCSLHGDHVVGAPAADCHCANGYDPDSATGTCKRSDSGGGLPMWAKIAIGAVVGVGILCLVKVHIPLICPGKKKKDDPPGTCVLPLTGTYPNCACNISCTAGATLNAVACRCDVVPPPVCPLPVQTRNAQGVCTCDASLCASGTTQDPVTCQCSVIPLCPGTTTPVPAGGVANCPPPACPDGQPRQNGNCPTNCGNGVYVYSPNTCPSTNEGGNGNSCTNPPCSGGVPTGTGH